MWNAKGNDLQMAIGDFGVELPVTVSGATFSSGDALRFTFKDARGSTILVKTYDTIVQNTVSLSFTEEESALFRAGRYDYSLDWYQDDLFMCNIIPTATLKVVGKA